MSEPDFERLYRESSDPFQVASTWYEQRKIGVTLAILAERQYDLIWECACGTGHLASALTDRGPVVASDAAASAVELANGRPSVRAVRNALPAAPSTVDGVDLIVVSEVLYYLPADLRRSTYATFAALGPSEIVAVHWRPRPHDGTISGLDVTDELEEALAGSGWRSHARYDDDDFVARSWRRGTVVPPDVVR